MKVLFLTPDLPDPPDQGAKLRSLALIRAAAAHHQVDLLTFAYPSRLTPLREAESEPRQVGAVGHASHLEDICRRVQSVDAPTPRSLLVRSWYLLFEPLPDLARRLDSSVYHAALADMLAHDRYDVVQIEGLEMIPYLGTVRAGAPHASVVYDAHNAEMSLQRSIFQAEFRDARRWHGALYSLVQWSKLGGYERVMMNATDLVIAVSDEDAAKLRGRHVAPELVPNGVDSTAIAYHEPPNRPRRRLLFVGAMHYRPNADAMRWFVSRVLPRLQAAVPDVHLRIVGLGTERIRGDRVEGAGYVADAAQEFAAADVVVVPMRMGSGVRFKVLEAMAAGVPVVSTPLGLAGIAGVHERHALVARSAEDFAAAIQRVLHDSQLARQLAANARRLVEERYDWWKIAPHYLRLLSDARRAARSRPEP